MVHHFIDLRFDFVHFTILAIDVIVAHFHQFGKSASPDRVQIYIHIGQLDAGWGREREIQKTL